MKFANKSSIASLFRTSIDKFTENDYRDKQQWWEFIKENKKVRKQENTLSTKRKQKEKRKENTLSTKKAIKKKR